MDSEAAAVNPRFVLSGAMVNVGNVITSLLYVNG